jgi:RNA polymerase sigma-70 factor (ECF subfamily)
VDEERDETLASRAAEGCRTSFASLLERHYDRVYRLAWRWSGSRSAGEDIAQDVVVKLARAIRSYRSEAAFGTWLHRITYTTTIDFLRSNQRSVAVDPSEIVRLVDSAGVEPLQTRDTGDLWAAVRSLPEQQRDAVLLVYGEDMSHADAASVMGCSEKTVSWHLHEARKRLKILLEAVG